MKPSLAQVITSLPDELKTQLNMFLEENRLKTFTKWIFDENQPCNADKMAEAGFYLVATSEEPDCVQCFWCSKTLDGWESTDDPWQEHLSHARNCKFAQMQKPEDCISIEKLTELRNEQYAHVIRKYVNELTEAENVACEQILSVISRTIKAKK